jgi:hypothetical protein
MGYSLLRRAKQHSKQLGMRLTLSVYERIDVEDDKKEASDEII